MSQPNAAQQPKTAAQPNRIGTLEFAVDVASDGGIGQSELATPDRLLLAIRQELLGEIDAVMAAAGQSHSDLTIPALELDLGAFPDPPDWDTVRDVLRRALQSALAPYLHPRPAPAHIPARAPLTMIAPQAIEKASDIAALRLVLTGHKNPTETYLHAALGRLQPEALQALLQKLAYLEQIPQQAANGRSHAANDDTAGPAQATPLTATLRRQLVQALQSDDPVPPEPAAVVRTTDAPPADTWQNAAFANLGHLAGVTLTATHLQRLIPTGKSPANGPRPDAAALRVWVAGRHARAEVIVAALSDPQVKDLISALVPQQADALKTALSGLDQVDSPSAARRLAATDLLVRSALDIGAIRNAAPPRTLRPEIALAHLLAALGDTPVQAATTALYLAKANSDPAQNTVPRTNAAVSADTPAPGTAPNAPSPDQPPRETNTAADAIRAQTPPARTPQTGPAHDPAIATQDQPPASDPHSPAAPSTGSSQPTTTIRQPKAAGTIPDPNRAPLPVPQSYPETNVAGTSDQADADATTHDPNPGAQSQSHPADSPIAQTPPRVAPALGDGAGLASTTAPSIPQIGKITPPDHPLDTSAAPDHVTPDAGMTRTQALDPKPRPVDAADIGPKIPNPLLHKGKDVSPARDPNRAGIQDTSRHMTPKSPDAIFNDPDQSQNPDVAQTKPTSDQPADPTAPETTLSSPAPTPSAKPRNDPTRSRQTDSAMSRADHAKPTRIPDIAGQPTDPSTPDKALPPATSTARTQDAATSQPRRSEIAETVQENDAPTLPTSDVAAHRTGADAKTAPTQAGPQPPNASPDSPRLPATARAAPSTDRLQDVPLVDAPSDDDRALAEQRMQALFAKVTGDTYSTVAPMLDLVWSVLGTGPHVNATDRAQFWALAVGAAAQTTPTAEDQDHIIATFVMAVLPRPDHRIGALRAAIARLGYATGGIAPGLRHQARATLTKVLDQLNTPPAAPTKTTTKAPVARATATRVMTAQSGLVLFHPYIAMLFTRMEIARDARGIAHQDMGRAAAALWWLAMGAGAPPKPADPLVNCLLGLAFHTPAPPVVTLDTDTRSLIDGLIQSVIAQWARLGGTSADGLRAAFVQRAGVLRQDEAATILTVTPGPYDMLLDSLPWSINMIGLPWMPTPLSVKWRGSDD